MTDSTNQEVAGPVRRTTNPYPRPTRGTPSMKALEHMVFDGVARATDGCSVEPDGTCPHGYPSWLLQLGYV